LLSDRRLPYGRTVMDRRSVIAAYRGATEGADGLALGRQLAGLTGGEVTLARVRRRDGSPYDRNEQLRLHNRQLDMRRALDAAVPATSRWDLLPAADRGLARGLHEMSARQKAGFLVVGTTRRRRAGRLLAEQVAPGSPCAVAVAPPGYHRQQTPAPPVIGVAYDGSPGAEAALRLAGGLATATGTTLRLLAAISGGRGGEGERLERALAAALERCPEGTESLRLDGDAAAVLRGATDGMVSVLVMGAPRHGPLRHAITGGTAAGVLRAAACPVILCPADAELPTFVAPPALPGEQIAERAHGSRGLRYTMQQPERRPGFHLHDRPPSRRKS
jgi:nucleotide-binding universal stress UspA family protein